MQGKRAWLLIAEESETRCRRADRTIAKEKITTRPSFHFPVGLWPVLAHIVAHSCQEESRGRKNRKFSSPQGSTTRPSRS